MGLGCSKNEEDAAVLIEKSANGENIEAMCCLSCLYKKGIGYSKNKALAKMWKEKAKKVGLEKNFDLELIDLFIAEYEDDDFDCTSINNWHIGHLLKD